MAEPTDREIQNWVRQEFGFWPESAWIAHCKLLCGLNVENVRAYQQSRVNPCPLDKQFALTSALRHFKLVPKA